MTPPEDPAEACAAAGIDLLPVEPRHVREVTRLPHHHGDPFDRMLLAQARVEGLVLVTRDARLPAYDVEVLRA